jgi:Tfp pilus assembly PilM family ATPase
MLRQNFSSFKRKKGSGSTMLGIDIGSYSIKVLELSLTGTGPEIKGLAKKELPPEMRKGERDKNLLFCFDSFSPAYFINQN